MLKPSELMPQNVFESETICHYVANINLTTSIYLDFMYVNLVLRIKYDLKPKN